MATAKRAANSARGAESVLSDELVSIRALRVCAVASQAGDVGQCQSLCLKSYPVRVGDDGKRVAGETGCELWEVEPAMDSERCEAWQNGIVSARQVI